MGPPQGPSLQGHPRAECVSSTCTAPRFGCALPSSVRRLQCQCSSNSKALHISMQLPISKHNICIELHMLGRWSNTATRVPELCTFEPAAFLATQLQPKSSMQACRLMQGNRGYCPMQFNVVMHGVHGRENGLYTPEAATVNGAPGRALCR